jgi:hypothetical protein
VSRLHRFDDSLTVEAKWAPVLDAWFRNSCVVELATRTQQWGSIDRVAHTATGSVLLEYKCDQKAQGTAEEEGTGNLFMETVACTTTGREGWLYMCRADWLVYFATPDIVWMFRPDRLRAAEPAWRRQFPERKAPNLGFDTLGLCVPFRAAADVADYIFLLPHDRPVLT